MSNEVKLPDIGDFKNVPVIEVSVSAGDQVSVDDVLIVLESDKATMDIPSPVAGTVAEVKVKPGDTVTEGDLILVMAETAGSGAPKPGVAASAPAAAGHGAGEGQAGYGSSAAGAAGGSAPAAPAPQAAAPVAGEDMHAEVLVLGAGPGGYTAAFRAADLGKKVVLIERWPMLGGVCLNVGCIPSKALLHAAKVIDETHAMAAHGISFTAPQIDIDKLREWKDGVVKRLTGGLGGLAKQRKVTVVTGTGRFVSPNQIEVEHEGTKKVIGFDQAIIAAGSEPIQMPFIPHDDPRVIDSTGALELDGIPKRLLVIGGGIIGLEMATVYHALGAKVTIVELMDQIIPGADKDIVTPLFKRIGKQYEAIHLKAKVTNVEATPEGLKVTFEGGTAPATDTFDKILVSVGRRPNGKLIAADKAGVVVDERGFIAVDKQMRTNVPHIFAIGDVVGQPMLAHKAVHEGKVAAETASGKNSFFDAKVIPSVAYTDPEVAWVGLTENEAKAKGIKVGKGVFPWAASGRSLSLGRDEGITKVLFNEATDRIVGCGIVGPSAGDLIAEAALAIELGADAEDIGLTIHPHPTLSETVGMAAEAFEGTITDLYMPKKPHPRSA
ncbi:dihydrolipoyl dehydrogenase [Methylobacterium brachythecii]|uniref:Dihydrolipoyl dehydrogenase n=1 Tax=Methylobacterium brachythecii TaxID=1176177 RepID=A0A7W6AND0_9HYPH|nr:dihydrolipoyl dehydrogenase [Methylobacterium brachythecii]MBB3904989.1 dihydrolipoamide dehydrogenase [Methylobacterium brachythecii]GLS45775.1 dihydrolipoyl dehydrogenase [Methylobacterium brachythecii]